MKKNVRIATFAFPGKISVINVEWFLCASHSWVFLCMDGFVPKGINLEETIVIIWMSKEFIKNVFLNIVFLLLYRLFSRVNIY